MERKSFILYQSFEKQFEMLSQKGQALLIMAIFQYERTRKPPEGLPKQVLLNFEIIRDQLDRDWETYVKRCRKNRENIMHRYANSYDRIQSNTTEYDGIFSYRDNDNDNDNDNGDDNENVSVDERSKAPQGRAGTRERRKRGEGKVARRGAGRGQRGGCSDSLSSFETDDFAKAALSRSLSEMASP